MQKLLTLLLASALLGSSCKTTGKMPVSSPLSEKEEKAVKAIKYVAALGAGVLTIYGGFKLYRHLKHLGVDTFFKHKRRVIDDLGAIKTISLDNPPLYRLVNTKDGSKHYILGTIHYGGANLADVPDNSPLIRAARESTTFISEVNENALNPRVLEEANAILATDTVEEQAVDPKISNLLTRISLTLDIGLEKLGWTNRGMMDLQLRELAVATNKENLGFESLVEQAAAFQKSNQKAIPNLDYEQLEDVMQLLDSKGVENIYLEARELYAKGDVDGLVATLNRIEVGTADDVLLDERNEKWVRSGIVQNNCRKGKKCFVYVGAKHLFEGNNSLEKMLKTEGFVIEKIK